MAAVLLISLPATAAQTAATVYALNCLGCHFPPEEFTRDAPPLIGQFAQTEGETQIQESVVPPEAGAGRKARGCPIRVAHLP